jgi:hypothetical protein
MVQPPRLKLWPLYDVGSNPQILNKERKRVTNNLCVKERTFPFLENEKRGVEDGSVTQSNAKLEHAPDKGLPQHRNKKEFVRPSGQIESFSNGEFESQMNQHTSLSRHCAKYNSQSALRKSESEYFYATYRKSQ